MAEFEDLFVSSFELEAHVIGALLDDGGHNWQDFDLSVDDFGEPSFVAVFEVMQGLVDRQRFFDYRSVDWLLAPQWKQAFWLAYELAGFQARFLPVWLPFLYDQSSKRLVKRISDLLQAGENTAELMQQAKEMLERVERSQFVLPDLKLDMRNALLDALNPKRALPTVYPLLNNVVRGFVPGRLYVFGARPSVGKTLVGLELAWGLSAKHGVAFASVEMSKSELYQRVFSQELSIDMNDFESSSVSPADQERINKLISVVDNRITIVDDSRQTVGDLRRLIQKLKQGRGCDVLFVDYLQKLTTDNVKLDKRQRIDEIAVGLKAIARDFGVAVVALTQLNRDAKGDTMPSMENLKESGQIEQEADVVVLLHREKSQWDDQTNLERLAEGLPELKSTMILNVTKNRHGSPGAFKMTVLGHYARLGVH